MVGVEKAIYSPLSVAKAARRLMEVGLIKGEPVWYQPVLNTPPMADLSRKAAQTHQHRSGNRPNDIREIQSIQGGVELKIRTRFFKEHPWELARPRVVVEEDGADYARQDWSRMEQMGKPLDGESVVQRTMYLMQETKPPTRRYQEIHGFDESKARGRPCSSLPPFGNIPEPNRDVDNILRTWSNITGELENTLREREFLRSRREEELSRRSTTSPVLTTLRDRIKSLSDKVHRLQKQSRKMSRLAPEVAYLQACSEFYLLRQQEEVEARIALEQARCFGREMAPTVNETELVKEQQTLREWKTIANRQFTLIDEARKKQDTADGRKVIEDEETTDELLLASEALEPVAINDRSTVDESDKNFMVHEE